MTHKTSYLSGPEPEEDEKKTTAQLEDEKQPSSITISTNMYNDAEIGDHPSIEQHFKQNEIRATAHTGKNFTIDENFKEAIHQREKIEHEERMKARAEAAKEEQERRQIRNQEIAEIIQESQTLDPKEIKDEQAKTTRTKNLEKLYPDPIPEQSDVEEELWQRRKDKGAQIAGRAKLEDVYDSELHSGILKSFGFQIIGLGLLALPSLEDTFSPWYIKLLFYAGGAVACFYSYYILKQVSKRYLNKKLPSDQENAFTLATILPFMALRIAITSIFTSVPFLGGILGTIICVFIGSGLHYSFLAKYHIPASKEIVAINVLAYVFILLIPSLISFITNPSGGATEMLIVVSWAVQIAIFFIGDRLAAKMAPSEV